MTMKSVTFLIVLLIHLTDLLPYCVGQNETTNATTAVIPHPTPSILVAVIDPEEASTPASSSVPSILTADEFHDKGHHIDKSEESDDSGDEGSDAEEEEVFKIPQDAVEFMDYFDDLVRRVKVSLEGVFNQYWPQLFEMSSSVVLSPECTYDVVRVLMALRAMRPWAIKREYSLDVSVRDVRCSRSLLSHTPVLDASGKVPEGILAGTLSSLGAYDECLETTLGDEEEDNKGTNGQYCSIDIKPFLPPKPPSSSGTLNQIFNDAADAKGFPKVRSSPANLSLPIQKLFFFHIRRITFPVWPRSFIS